MTGNTEESSSTFTPIELLEEGSNFDRIKKKKIGKITLRERRDYGAPSSVWRRIFLEEGSTNSSASVVPPLPLEAGASLLVSWPLLLSFVVSLPFVTASRLVSSELITTDKESLVASDESSVTAPMGPDESSLSLPSNTKFKKLTSPLVYKICSYLVGIKLMFKDNCLDFLILT